MPDLLIELFSEEIPARMQKRAGEDLKKRVTDGLVEAGLTYASAAAFTTPRRLVLTLEGLTEESPNTVEERKGPKVGAPEKAIEGFLRSTGLTMDQLQIRDDKKGQVYFAVIEKSGRPAAQIIAEVLEDTIRNFPWPKSMRWGAGSLRWVRPLHSILCILTREDGAEVVPLSVDEIEAGNTTEGHRFMGEGRFAVTSFEDYSAKLKTQKVVIDPQERADHIWADATNMAFAQGLEVVEDNGLLAEVAGLVEWPVVLMGEIGEDFLGLPAEVLQTSMKEHQKFFSVRDPKTGKIVKFVTVANVETPDNGATILEGNQKVLAARLSDAKFFWENDLREAKAGMTLWLDKLANVTFHNKLGTLGARVDRIAQLARDIAPLVGADADQAEQAARIAKADLASEMVYEFPELQGIMGRYYAQAAGFDEATAEVAEMHYKPLGPSDDVPTAPLSVAVSLAEKLDILTGFWAIDEKPTGSKDPFALRRAALGVIRLILKNSIRVPLKEKVAEGVFHQRYSMSDLKEFTKSLQDNAKKLSKSEVTVPSSLEDWRNYIHELESREGYLKDSESYHDSILEWFEFSKGVGPDLLNFFHDRLKVYLRDEGVSHDVIDACLAMPGSDDLTLLVTRAKALSAFVGSDDGENLLQGFKRANNILTQAEEADGVEYRYGADVKFAEDETEKALFAALDAQQGAISSAIEAEDFAAAMQGMAALRAPIDAFFEAVQVNTDNQVVRRNRLNLLHMIRETCSQVADLTRVEG